MAQQLHPGEPGTGMRRALGEQPVQRAVGGNQARKHCSCGMKHDRSETNHLECFKPMSSHPCF